MDIYTAFIITLELEFKSYFGLEVADIKIPLPHFMLVANSLPDPFHGRCVDTLDDKWLVLHKS
jgi:hypothetical protein